MDIVEGCLCKIYENEIRNDYEERFQAVTQSATDAIISVNGKGEIVLWNKAAGVIFGYSENEMLNKPLTMIMPQKYRDNHKNGLESVVVTGNSKIIGRTVEVAGLKKDGTEFPIELSLSMWRVKNELFFTGIIRDITERKRTEEELKTAKAELEIRVKERTAELRNSNERLLLELAEKKRAEEELEKSVNKYKKSLQGTVNALAVTAEKKDLYTAGHQLRVSQLACAIALEMGLSGECIEGIRIAGMLHDIGKIVVPSEILSKPSGLSLHEFGIIKAHPQTGYEILKGIDFPWPVSQAVLQHHEKLNGSGYPEGITGEKIILEARILTVADVVEAMSSHRPYRPSLGVDKALHEISKNCHTLYDPCVVDVCIRLIEEKGYMYTF